MKLHRTPAAGTRAASTVGVRSLSTRGTPCVILPVYLQYWLGLLVKCRYQVDFTMVRMQKASRKSYEDPSPPTVTSCPAASSSAWRPA